MRALFYSSGFFRVINISTFDDNFEFHFREVAPIRSTRDSLIVTNESSIMSHLQLEWIYCQEKELFRIKKRKENIIIKKSEEKNCSNNAINSNCRQPICRNFGFFFAFGFLVMDEKSDGHKYAKCPEKIRFPVYTDLCYETYSAKSCALLCIFICFPVIVAHRWTWSEWWLQRLFSQIP